MGQARRSVRRGVAEHVGLLYRTARRVLLDPHEAEDAAQEAVGVALAKAGEYDPARPLRPWLVAIAYRTAVTRLRSKEARMRREAKVVAPRAAEDPSTRAVRAEQAELLRGAVEALALEERAPLALHYFEGFTHREIAEALSLAPTTVQGRIERALDRLRGVLSGAALALAPAGALEAALGSVKLESAPAALAAKAQALVAGKVAAAGLGTAKGGIAMKIVAGIVAAGAVAGAVAVSTGAFQGEGSGPLARVADGEPAPVNPYNGMQEREEVFEFARKPSVKKEGDRWIITFASKGKCDATVSIVDKDGKVVRHLASGVLGVNAPWPFQQNLLSQKIEWDGQTDTRKKAPAGCKVRVSLGLQARFERNILWHPNAVSDMVVLGIGKDGETYVGNIEGRQSNGRVFDKNGKYLRTFWPPPAADLEKAMAAMGTKMVPTKWGDKVPVAAGEYWAPSTNTTQWLREVKDLPGALAKRETYGVKHLVKAMEKLCGLDPAKLKRAPRPAAIAQDKMPSWIINSIFAKFTHLDVDPEREELYAGAGKLFRFDGKTGEFDTSFYPNGELSMLEFCIGPESTVYVRIGPYGKLLVRLNHAGKTVPFKENTVVPDWPKAPWSWKPKFFPGGGSGIDLGIKGFSATHQNGFAASPDGTRIVTCIREIDPAWIKKHGLPPDPRRQNTHISVYSVDGRMLAADAVGEIRWGHGLGMDREGNLYCAYASLMPHGQRRLDGIVNALPGNAISEWGSFGSLVKFRGLGEKFPLGGLGAAGGGGAPLKVSLGNHSGPGQQKDAAIAGGLWAYGGLTNQKYGSCNCHHARWHLDRWARTFVPANHLYSIMVLDSNGNRIARFGRYGNVDDNGPKVGGIHVCWPRAIAASDTAFYVADHGNERILKAALSYAAEEEAALDGSSASSAPAPAPAARTTDARPAAEAPSASAVSRAEPSAADVCRGWLSLARSYARAGRADKAREYLEKVIRQHPGTEYAARARRELASL